MQGRTQELSKEEVAEIQESRYVDRLAKLSFLKDDAIALGAAFSIGQEARGAHFLSHDLTSAAIVWFVQLGLYAWYRRAG